MRVELASGPWLAGIPQSSYTAASTVVVVAVVVVVVVLMSRRKGKTHKLWKLVAMQR